MGDLGSIPGWERSSGEGNGNPFQYSCLENPMGGGAWWATVHGVAKRWTWLSDFTFTLLILQLPLTRELLLLRYCICIQTMGWKKDLVVLGHCLCLCIRKAKSFPDTPRRKWLHYHWSERCHLAFSVKTFIPYSQHFLFLSLFLRKGLDATSVSV